MRCWPACRRSMGLYASILPMIVYALTGSGRQTSVGPVTVDSLMLVLGLSTLATAGTALVHRARGAGDGDDRRRSNWRWARCGWAFSSTSFRIRCSPGSRPPLAVITVLGQLQAPVLGISQPQHPRSIRNRDRRDRRTPARPTPAPSRSRVGCIVALWAVRRWAPTAPGATGSRRRLHGARLCLRPGRSAA